MVDHRASSWATIFLTPRLKPKDPDLLGQAVGFMNSGRTLVLTGCNVFDSRNIGDWQQYATAHNITIIGCAATVDWSSGSVSGVWVTLTPGGTAPTIK